MRVPFAKRFILSLGAALIPAMVSSHAQAHDLWVEAQNHTLQPNQVISVALGLDHCFPAQEFLPEENLEEIYLLDPQGKRIGMKRYDVKALKAEQPVKQEGIYLVGAKQKARFWTKTTEGYRSGQSKKGLQNVISCTYSAKFAKSIVQVGGAGGGSVSRILGHELEIIPSNDPGRLHAGGSLPVKVLFKGKPLPSCQVFATYMGFSTERNTFAYATKTNKEGTAKIKIFHSGVWLIAASHAQAHPDPKECDEERFSSTLTFEVK
jgi:uncharacterized GH25 family protein